MTSANGVSAFRYVAAGLQSDVASNKRSPKFIEGSDEGVAATQYMLGTMELTPQTEFYNPREERGSRIETHRVVAVARHGEMSFESSLQYQRAPMWFSMVFGNPGNEKSTQGSTIAAAPPPNHGTVTALTNSGCSVKLMNLSSGANQYDPGADFPSDSPTTATIYKGPATENKVPGIVRYTFAPEPGWLLQPSIWTMWYGDNYYYYQMKNAFVRNFEMTYAMNDAVMVSAEMFGSFPVAKATTANVSQPLVHDAVSQFTDLYLGDVTDANLHPFSRLKAEATAFNAVTNPRVPVLQGIRVDGNIQSDAAYIAAPGGFGDPSGSTADTSAHDERLAGVVSGAVNPLAAMRKPSLCNAISLSIPTGIEMTRYTSGSIDFTSYGQTIRTVNLDLTLRHNAEGKTEYDKYVDDSDRRRLVRLVTKGPTIFGFRNTASSDAASFGSIDDSTYNPFKHFIAIDMTMLYTDSPQFFTEEGGDDLYTIRGSSYHEGNKWWNRDIVAYVQTNRPMPDYDRYY